MCSVLQQSPYLHIKRFKWRKVGCRGVLLKVNSVQEACAKCFSVHILKFKILQITWKRWNKKHQTLSFQFFTNRFGILMFFVCFFMWFARFQILISEPKSIWRKLLVLRWLYSGIVNQRTYYTKVLQHRTRLDRTKNIFWAGKRICHYTFKKALASLWHISTGSGINTAPVWKTGQTLAELKRPADRECNDRFHLALNGFSFVV